MLLLVRSVCPARYAEVRTSFVLNSTTCANCFLDPFVSQYLGHPLIKLKDLVPA